MEALMRPTELTDAFVALIERRAEAPCSVAERPARIAALEKEVEGLRYIEEALLTAATAQGEVVTRSTDAPPWCVLGVKIVEKPQKRAAA
jgi:hypothetical protein